MRIVEEFIVAGCAGTSACIFTNPVEVVKTRLQLQGELASHQRPYRGPVDAIVKIWKYEGIRGVHAGFVPAVMYQLAMNGVRLGSYTQIKQMLGAEDSKNWKLARLVTAGAISGALGGIVGNSFFLIKVRLQNQTSDPRIAVGYQHSYKGAWDAWRHLIRDEGISGLFRGAPVQALRVAAGSAAQLSTYDSIKQLLKKHAEIQDGWILHFASSAGAGVFTALAMNPVDVIATRLYNQPVQNGKGILYTGALDCALKSVKAEGFGALYKGLLPHYFRLAPHTILTLVFWEQYKSLAQK
jgi:solute carrier family 25 protein 34/35